jgi:hypothetical protein
MMWNIANISDNCYKYIHELFTSNCQFTVQSSLPKILVSLYITQKVTSFKIALIMLLPG